MVWDGGEAAVGGYKDVVNRQEPHYVPPILGMKDLMMNHAMKDAISVVFNDRCGQLCRLG